MKSLIALFLVVLLAATKAQTAGYADHPRATALIEELVTEEGFERDRLETLLATAERKESILRAISRPAEKTKSWGEYRRIFVTSARTSQGLEFYSRFGASLQRAEREYGVPAEIIVAIIGVETSYGRNKGRYRVLDALTTLAFDYPKRAAFFSQELKHFLILTREQQLAAEDLLGSYAGAMGYGQFMPSSYRAYAVDFDGDGSVDIWNNPVDAIGSVANYFRSHGWSPDAPVTARARVRGEYPSEWMNEGLKPKRSVAEFAAAGIEAQQPFAADALATAMELDGAQGAEYWLGLQNFYVITRYNHSAMYAMSVYQLSQELRSRR